MRRAPQYAHLNARTPSRSGAQRRAEAGAACASRHRTTARAARVDTPRPARRNPAGSASAAFRPHPLADPVKLHVSAH
ncbi:hypothetical protein WJ17_27640 [Burkholderia vietnamiensis]|nr:hypothetical protein WI92_30590 [Burkholderia vietnamiensis]KVF63078.1 hypothetical protein WJ17_27640 [Burkholderia vietnamiensis]